MRETFTVTLDGAILRRGFWLYVWEITTPDGRKVLYVGRTGDKSSPFAQSLFNRLGQNLGTLANAEAADAFNEWTTTAARCQSLYLLAVTARKT